MTDEIKSFEKLWDEAEKRSLQVNKNDDTAFILYEMEYLLHDIKDNLHQDNELPADIKASITSDVVGKLLFMLSTITARENVNIWSALKKHIDNT